MRSKRKYPPRNCKARYCGKSFIPHDARQEFCVPQCRIDENNDIRSDIDRPFNEDRKKIKKNDKVLAAAFKKLRVEQKKFINYDFLEFAGYEFGSYFKQKRNASTGNMVYWNIRYGIEPSDDQRNLFIIHKK